MGVGQGEIALDDGVMNDDRFLDGPAGPENRLQEQGNADSPACPIGRGLAGLNLRKVDGAACREEIADFGFTQPNLGHKSDVGTSGEAVAGSPARGPGVRPAKRTHADA